MASDTTASGSLVFERRVGHVHKYHWPALQLNIWMLIMLIAASTIIGIFATFIQVQQQLLLAVPWCVFPSPSTNPPSSPSVSLSNIRVPSTGTSPTT
jgi:hypothetical protein